MPAHDRAHGDQSHLMAAGTEYRPVELVAEQMIGDAAHVHEVLGLRPDPAKDPVNGLDQHRRLDQAPVDEMREVVQVADVVALELEFGAALLAQVLERKLDILVRVAEDEVARVLEILRLPVELPLLVLRNELERAEA